MHPSTSPSPSQPDDLTAAASALLLLEASPDESEASHTDSATISRSCSEVAVELSCVSDEIGGASMEMLVMAALLHGIKRKSVVVKKPRSKRKSIKRVIKLYEDEEERSTASAISSVTASSTATSARFGNLTVKKKLRGRPVKKGKEVLRYWWQRPSVSTWWRATVIMAFLSAEDGWRSEIQIREAFGNSPDTSKALRLLLRMEEVIRTGRGGRRDPFLYTVAQPRSSIS